MFATGQCLLVQSCNLEFEPADLFDDLFGLPLRGYQFLIGRLQAVARLDQVILAEENLLLDPHSLRAQVGEGVFARPDGVIVKNQHQQHHGPETAAHDVEEG
jgi:hypothetical protein